MPGARRPYWLTRTDESTWPTPEADGPPTRADLVVVGGGIAGLAAALWSARLGARTVLLEGAGFASGATSRNIGLMLFGGELDRQDVFADLCADEAFAAHPRSTPHLSLLDSPDLVDVVANEAATRESVELLDRRDCESLLATSVGQRFLAGRRAHNALVVDPVRLARGVATAAVGAGALIYADRGVRRVTAGRGSVRVDLGDGAIHCDAVVIAAGLGANTLIPGLPAVLRARTVTVWRAEAAPGLFGPVMAVNFGDVYWRQLPDGPILVGGIADGGEVARFFADAFPQLPVVRAVDGWTGTMANTPDGRPLIGPVPAAPGVWLLTGFGGHGLPPVAYASRLVVRAALGVEPTPPELAHRYSLGRFPAVGDR